MRPRYLAPLVCLAVACSDNGILQPVEGLTHAIATNSCGPADGSQVTIILAAQPFELPHPVSNYVRVTLPVSFSTLEPGRVFDVDESFDAANAWRVQEPTVSLQADDGEVGITSVSTTALSGYVDLRFPDGTRIRGSFNATRQESLILCG